jgi:aspartate-semialdehyde dehydrogenase
MKLSEARIVVTGATHQLGRDILSSLADSGVKPTQVTALESGRSGDHEISFGENHIMPVKSSDEFNFAGTHIVLHGGAAREAAGMARKSSAANAVFVDGSGTFAFDPDVPLIVPEVNGTLLEQTLKKNVVANPNSVSIFLALALNPIHAKAKVLRVVASTYQAVSHWGREAQDELFNQTKAVFMAHKFKSEHLPKQIAFNPYPILGHEREDGLSETEFHAIGQLKKILDPKIKVAVNTVTIPAFVGDGMMVNVECAEEITPIKAALWMTGQKGLGVMEEDDAPTHAEISGEEFTYVSRIRDDMSVENGIAFWLIGDNLRKGSALNMVQIAEKVLSTR